MNDALPDLQALRALGRRFDLVLLSAVWMHVAPKGRERAFRILCELLGPSGLLVITLRRGGDAAENAARGFHDASAEELIGHANRRAIALRSRTTRPDLRRPSLTWETLAFRPSARRPVRCGSGRHPHTRHQRACANIEKMPVRYITYPGSADRRCSTRGSDRCGQPGPFVLSREYLAQFGRFRIPAQLGQALSHYACWLDPVIVREWRQ